MQPVVETTSTHVNILSVNNILTRLKKLPQVLFTTMHQEKDGSITVKAYQKLLPIGVNNIGHNSKIVYLNN